VRDNVQYKRIKGERPPIVPVESVRINNCDLSVGHQQSGILLVNVKRANVENNVIQVYDIPESLTLKKLLENKKYRSAIRSLMINSPKLGRPEHDDVFIPGNVIGVSAGKGYVWFKTDRLLASAWTEWLKISPAKGVQNDRDMLFHVINVANKVLLNDGLLRGGIEPFSGFKSWYDEKLISENISVGSQGIVTGGTAAKEIHITNNKISGFMQGIHIGTSHTGVTTGNHDKADIVQIMSNNVEVLLSPVVTRERHGIFVGNCDSLIIQNNYVSIMPCYLTKDLNIDGIRVYGHPGRMMVVNQNHIVNANREIDNPITGILFVPLSGESGNLQWIIAGNIAPGSIDPVKVLDKSGKFLNKVRVEHNFN